MEFFHLSPLGESKVSEYLDCARMQPLLAEWSLTPPPLSLEP